MPTAVEKEILHRPILYPIREYPYATLFRHLRNKLLDPPNPEPEPVKQPFGPGEGAALALASILKAPILVNESAAKIYGANLGLTVITVPAVIVTLLAQGVISDQAAGVKLSEIEANTAPEIVAEAREAIKELGED